jgi:hypothetical protein
MILMDCDDHTAGAKQRKHYALDNDDWTRLSLRVEPPDTSF